MTTTTTGSTDATQRHYESATYLLPADELETKRLNLQHRMLVTAFEGRLVLAPISLKDGDRVLESAVGTGIWALEFAGKHPGSVIDGIDITSRQFTAQSPPNLRFSINSITNLPADWSNRFAFAHQRLLVVALTAPMWKTAIAEMYRVLTPGGWVELIEPDSRTLPMGVGPHSKRLVEVIHKLYQSNGVVEDLNIQLPVLLKDAGFVDIHLETRPIPIRESIGDGINRSELIYDLWMGMKVPVLNAGGYGLVASEEEFDAMMEGSKAEWKESDEANLPYFTVYAQKPSTE